MLPVSCRDGCSACHAQALQGVADDGKGQLGLKQALPYSYSAAVDMKGRQNFSCFSFLGNIVWHMKACLSFEHLHMSKQTANEDVPKSMFSKDWWQKAGLTLTILMRFSPSCLSGSCSVSSICTTASAPSGTGAPILHYCSLVTTMRYNLQQTGRSASMGLP